MKVIFYSSFILAMFVISLSITTAELSITTAENGIDVSPTHPIAQDTWTCLKNNGFTFGVVQIYRCIHRTGGVVYATETIKNAETAGFSKIDGYILPCFGGAEEPESQVQKAVNNLKRDNVTIGRIWIAVENTYNWRSRSLSPKIDWIHRFVQEVKAQKYSVGIRTSDSATDWLPITENSVAFKDVQLWYKGDSKPDFADFKPFGGWTSPVMKQYNDNIDVCNVDVTSGKNWRL